MHDAGVGRHHLEVAERGLSPAQEHVALGIALELDFIVVPQRIGRPVFIDLDRVVDHQLGRRERIHALGIPAEACDRLSHSRQVDDARHAGKVLHDHARRSEGDFVARRGFGIPAQQRLDVVRG